MRRMNERSLIETTDKKQSQSTMKGHADQQTNRTTIPSQNAQASTLSHTLPQQSIAGAEIVQPVVQIEN